jgi:hypothetical protein
VSDRDRAERAEPGCREPVAAPPRATPPPGPLEPLPAEALAALARVLDLLRAIEGRPVQRSETAG